MAGINAEIPEPSTKSRFFELTFDQLPEAEWQQFSRRCDQLLTPTTGQRLLRRTLNSLEAIQQNCSLFAEYLSAAGLHGRECTKLALMLGFAYSLTSTEPIYSRANEQDDRWWSLTEQWLEANNFTLDLGQQGHQQRDQTESRKCLDHLLTKEVPWLQRREVDDTTPTSNHITVQELLEVVRSSRDERIRREAEKVLGRLGIRLYSFEPVSGPTRLTIAIANRGEAIDKVFGRSQWKDGAHREHLLELDCQPRVVPCPKNLQFKGGGDPKRAVLVPVEAVFSDNEAGNDSTCQGKNESVTWV